MRNFCLGLVMADPNEVVFSWDKLIEKQSTKIKKKEKEVDLPKLWLVILLAQLTTT